MVRFKYLGVRMYKSLKKRPKTPQKSSKRAKNTPKVLNCTYVHTCVHTCVHTYKTLKIEGFSQKYVRVYTTWNSAYVILSHFGVLARRLGPWLRTRRSYAVATSTYAMRGAGYTSKAVFHRFGSKTTRTRRTTTSGSFFKIEGFCRKNKL